MTKKKPQKRPPTALRTLHYFFAAYKKHKWYTIGGLLSTPIVILVRDIFEPLVLADMIEKISSGLTPEAAVATLLPEGALLLLLFFFGNVLLQEFRLYCVWKCEILCMYDLGTQAFETISAQSMQFHSNRFSGSLVSQTNRFTGSLERFSDVVIWDLIPFVTYVTAAVLVLFARVPGFTLALLAFVLLYTATAGLTSRKMNRLSEEEAAASTRETGQLADAITNITSVKSYARESHEKRRYASFQKSWQAAGLRLMHYSIRRDILFGLSNLGIVASVVAFMILGPSLGISIATLVLIVNYSNKILGNLWDVTHIFKNLVRSFGDAREMTEILDLPDDVIDAADAYDMELKDSSVDFSHITFRHADAKETIFEDFNLHIKPGERIGLVGVSGSGKTTLTRLLLRFADVADGEIRVGGHDIKKITQKSLRENIAYVPQETALFHRSIADNIAYAKPGATRKEIIRAAKLANADEFIKDTPDGYDTLVGERGIKLSGGQRQRIAIARAILKDAPLLVLDEATSALDSESEGLIQEALGVLMKGRTSLVIAHRLSTVASLDRIVVLDHGRIVEQGSHADLLKKGGTYARLWSRQSGAFMEEHD